MEEGGCVYWVEWYKRNEYGASNMMNDYVGPATQVWVNFNLARPAAILITSMPSF